MTVISALFLAVSGRFINNPLVQQYGNSADVNQSGLEQQQNGLYTSQLNQHSEHEVAKSRPEGEKTAKILSYHADNQGHHYNYAYETDNGKLLLFLTDFKKEVFQCPIVYNA